MKTIQSILLAVALLGAGCATTNLSDSGKARLAAASAVIQQAAAGGTLIAVQKDPKAAAYLKAAEPIICNLAKGDAISTQGLISALGEIREPLSVEAQLAINSLVGLYGALVSGSIGTEIAQNEYASSLLNALCDGLRQGLLQAKSAGLLP